MGREWLSLFISIIFAWGFIIACLVLFGTEISFKLHILWLIFENLESGYNIAPFLPAGIRIQF